MNLEAVYHRMKQNWSYAYDNKTLHIRIRTKRKDVSHIDLICGDKYNWNDTHLVVPMELWISDSQFDYWEAEVEPPYRRLLYYFALHNKGETIYLMEKGFDKKPPVRIYEGNFDFPFINPADVFSPPEWVKSAVFYQIFPERFGNGDASINPAVVEDWGGTPTPYNFFGGDLQGVIDHLDHLTTLGITAVYFNPLFDATTNHKYDTINYLKVDPQFGTNEKLKELVDACHLRGIRVILDAVFNHSGFDFPPFQDVIKNQKNSKYVDWFHIREFPIVTKPLPSYDTFGFEPLMPKLNTENPEVQAYLLDAAKYWIEEVGIDGWRLDVANEVDHQFWRAFRNTVKKVNPDAYILGEIMHDAMPWLQGDQFDAVMNYPFTNTLLNFFAHEEIDAAAFASAIGAQLASYPRQVNEVAFNLMGSHDTTRLLTLCKGNEKLTKLISIFQFTFYGVPCIYYGDEIGIDGEQDPYNRKCMEWDPEKQNLDLFQFYQQLIQLRKEYPALRNGKFKFLLAKKNDHRLVYERWDEQDHFIIFINKREKASLIRVPSSTDNWMDIDSSETISTQEEHLNVKVPALGYVILKAKV